MRKSMILGAAVAALCVATYGVYVANHNYHPAGDSYRLGPYKTPEEAGQARDRIANFCSGPWTPAPKYGPGILAQECHALVVVTRRGKEVNFHVDRRYDNGDYHYANPPSDTLPLGQSGLLHPGVKEDAALALLDIRNDGRQQPSRVL